MQVTSSIESAQDSEGLISPDSCFKHGFALRTARGIRRDLCATLRAGESELRAAHCALHSIFRRGRTAFRTNRLIAIGAAIRAFRQRSAALRTFAGQIKSAVGACFGIGVDFGVAFGTGQNHDRQRRAAVHTHAIACAGEPSAVGADELTALRARASRRVEVRTAVGASDLFGHDHLRAKLA